MPARLASLELGKCAALKLLLETQRIVLAARIPDVRHKRMWGTCAKRTVGERLCRKSRSERRPPM
ncbi:hypothetical protein PSEUDO9AG_40342 [Pseudomonas sp. 9Ag]|nr:hypothetical protein PSEUDO9AG_40342 [Pseudomonas sp. 9Ag]